MLYIHSQKIMLTQHSNHPKNSVTKLAVQKYRIIHIPIFVIFLFGIDRYLLFQCLLLKKSARARSSEQQREEKRTRGNLRSSPLSLSSLFSLELCGSQFYFQFLVAHRRLTIPPSSLSQISNGVFYDDNEIFFSFYYMFECFGVVVVVVEVAILVVVDLQMNFFHFQSIYIFKQCFILVF